MTTSLKNTMINDVVMLPVEEIEATAEECNIEYESASAEFQRIVEQHGSHLYRVALRLSGDREIAKDLIQETLARALRSFDRFEQGTNARAWLITILTRLYYDMLKHRRVSRRAEDDLVAVASSATELKLPGIPSDALWAAVNALEPDLRCVVERCYIHEMSYKAIAEELSVPIGTIGTRLRRARARLRMLLNLLDLTTT